MAQCYGSIEQTNIGKTVWFFNRRFRAHNQSFQWSPKTNNLHIKGGLTSHGAPIFGQYPLLEYALWPSALRELEHACASFYRTAARSPSILQPTNSRRVRHQLS
eukprot:5828229-Pyramimonas_sp.AAC.4